MAWEVAVIVPAAVKTFCRHPVEDQPTRRLYIHSIKLSVHTERMPRQGRLSTN